MISTIAGVITYKKDAFIVVEVGGIGFKVVVAKNIALQLPPVGSPLKLFTYLHVREDALELYGFLRHEELQLFQSLISISGIGPKSAMGIMGIAVVEQLVVAINTGKLDLLTRVSGVGKKTAERVILELKGKLTLPSEDPALLAQMESDTELVETLMSLGYTSAQAKNTISKIDPTIVDFKGRLKEALRKAKA